MIRSFAQQRGYKIFTVEEDKLIVEQMLNNFDVGPVRIATGRGATAVSYRGKHPPSPRSRFHITCRVKKNPISDTHTLLCLTVSFIAVAQ